MKSGLWSSVAGSGLGLLLASTFSTFWWWAFGAALFAVAALAVVSVLLDRPD